MGISVKAIKAAANYVLKATEKKAAKTGLSVVKDSKSAIGHELSQGAHTVPAEIKTGEHAAAKSMLKAEEKTAEVSEKAVISERTAKKAVEETAAKAPAAKAAQKIGKTKYELQLETQEKIDNILKSKIEDTPEYKAYIDDRLAHFKESDYEPEELAKVLEEQKIKGFRHYIMFHADDIKLTPEEENLIRDFNLKHKEDYLYGFFTKNDSPAEVYTDIIRAMENDRGKIKFDSIIWPIRANTYNQNTEKELIAHFENTVFKKCSNREIQKIGELIKYNQRLALHDHEKYIEFMKSDFVEMINRDLKDLEPYFGIGKNGGWANDLMDRTFRLCSPEVFAKRKANLIARHENINIQDINLETLLDMPEKDFKIFTQIKDCIPDNYKFTDIQAVADLIKKDKEFAKTVLANNYKETDFPKLLELRKRNPELIDNLVSKKYSTADMENFCNVTGKNPEFIQKYAKQGRDIKYLSSITECMVINPELTKELLELQEKGLRGKMSNSFGEESICKIVKFCKKDKDLAAAFTAQNDFGTQRISTYYIRDIIDFAGKDEKHAALVKRLLCEKKGESYRFEDGYRIKEICERYEKMSEIVEKLLNEKKDGRFRFDAFDIKTLTPLFEKDEVLARKLLDMKDHMFNASDVNILFPLYQKNPELTEKLLKMKDYSGKYPRFLAGDIEALEKSLSVNKNFRNFVYSMMRKTTQTKSGEIVYAYRGRTIREMANLRASCPEGKEIVDKLINMTYKDASGQTRQSVSDSMEILLNDLKDPDKKKIIQKFISDDKYQPFLTSYTGLGIKMLKSEGFLNAIIPHLEKDTRALLSKDGVMPNTKMIYARDNAGQKVLTFRYSPDNKTYKLIKEERLFSTDDKIVQKIKEGEHTFIAQKFTTREDGTAQSKISSRVNIKDKSAVTDVMTPSKVVPGEYDVTRYSHKAGKDAKKEVLASSRAFSKSGRKTVKNFTSSDGTITSIVRIEGEKGHGQKYVIKAKNGKVIGSIERHFSKIGENHYRSYLNGIRYDIQYTGDDIIVTKLAKDGSKATITLGSDIFDPALKDLYKQLPGDYYFKIKKAGLKKITIWDHVDDNACFKDDELSISMGKDLMTNPFVFAHELGHALDFTTLKKLDLDPKLIEIYRQEMNAFRAKTSSTESYVIDYFTQKFNKGKHYTNPADKKKKYNHALGEVIAESHALISGMKNSDFSQLGMRSVTLQENFPRTIAYIMNRIS